MELGEMGEVDGLVSKHAIDREILFGGKGFALGELVQHAGGHGGCVGSQNVLACFVDAPFVAISAKYERQWKQSNRNQQLHSAHAMIVNEFGLNLNLVWILHVVCWFAC